MRMSKKKEIVPKLRFPEFQGNGIDFLYGNRLFESITNKNYNSDLPILAITQDQGAVPRDQIEYNVTVTDKSLSNYKVVEVGDFIISLRSFQGGIEYSRFKGICSPAYIILRKREESISELYYKYYFKTWKYIQSLNRNLEGIRDGKMISYSQFSSIKVSYPRLFEEQQKIADCLSSIDELIDAESRKLKALEKYKKGLMQKLFPAEGKTLPEWRFPEFQACGGWEICTVKGSFDTITPPKKIVKSEYNNSGKYPIVDQSQEYIAGWTDDETAIVPYRRPLIIFGDHTCVLKFMSQPFAQGADGIKILSANHKLDEKFAYYCLENIPLNSNGYQRHYSALKEFIIKFPDRNSGEQQKIADCLSEIDTMITEQSDKVEQLKIHKKGLMQGLFPSLEEADE